MLYAARGLALHARRRHLHPATRKLSGKWTKPDAPHSFTKEQEEDSAEGKSWNSSWGPGKINEGEGEKASREVKVGRWLNPDKKVTAPQLSVPPPPNNEELSAPYIHNYLETDLQLSKVVTVSIPSSKSQGAVSHFVIASVPRNRDPMNSARRFVNDLCKNRINPVETSRQKKPVFGGYFIEGEEQAGDDLTGYTIESNYDDELWEEEEVEEEIGVLGEESVGGRVDLEEVSEFGHHHSLL